MPLSVEEPPTNGAWLDRIDSDLSWRIHTDELSNTACQERNCEPLQARPPPEEATTRKSPK